MDKASGVDGWLHVSQVKARRDMLLGERVAAHAVKDDSGELLESVELTPKSNQLGKYSWPFHFAELVNANAKHMCVGGARLRR